MTVSLTRSDLVGRQMRGVVHLKLQGGYGWIYEVEGLPRLRAMDQVIRSGKKAGSSRTWMVDGVACEDLDAAIAMLNGETHPEEPMPKISLSQQIDEIDRELKQRAKVYPRLAATAKLQGSVAEYQVARLKAARDTLAWLAENERAIKQRFAQ